MEQELRFGLDFGRFGNFWGPFSCFHGQEIFLKNIADGENIFGIYSFFLKNNKNRKKTKTIMLRNIFNFVLHH